MLQSAFHNTLSVTNGPASLCNPTPSASPSFSQPLVSTGAEANSALLPISCTRLSNVAPRFNYTAQTPIRCHLDCLSYKTSTSTLVSASPFFSQPPISTGAKVNSICANFVHEVLKY